MKPFIHNIVVYNVIHIVSSYAIGYRAHCSPNFKKKLKQGGNDIFLIQREKDCSPVPVYQPRHIMQANQDETIAPGCTVLLLWVHGSAQTFAGDDTNFPLPQSKHHVIRKLKSSTTIRDHQFSMYFMHVSLSLTHTHIPT